MSMEAGRSMTARQMTTIAERRDTSAAMRVLLVEGDSGLACCAGVEGTARMIETTLVAPVMPGDVLLVHGGIALVRLDDEFAP
jgi:hydrogenase maturation factor